jgi:hypothetical protein
MYQLLWTALRWLELREDEVLLVEGDEDIVKGLVNDKGDIVELTHEQVKRIAANVTVRSPAVHETIFGFLRSFHRHAVVGRKCVFVFTSTAARGQQKVSDEGVTRPHKAELAADVLAAWQQVGRQVEVPVTAEVLAADIRRLIAGHGAPSQTLGPNGARAKSTATSELTAALEYLDSSGRWREFFESVTWNLEQLDGNALFKAISRGLANDSRLNGLPADDVAARLIYELLIVGSRDAPQERTVSRRDLSVFLESAGVVLEAWAVSRQSEIIADWLRRTDRLEQRVDTLEGQVAAVIGPSEEADGELTLRFRTWLMRDTGGFRMLGIDKPIELENAWCVQARMDGKVFDASLLLEAGARHLAVVGTAGAGKSTVLQRLANRATVAGMLALRIRLPALLECKREGVPIGLALIRLVSADSAFSTAEAGRVLRSADLILADGLDGCGSDALNLLDELVSYARNLPKSRLIVSTRPEFDSRIPDGLKQVELLPLEASDVPDVIARLLHAIGESDDHVARAVAALSQVHRGASFELTSLNIVLTLHLARTQHGAELSRAGLYAAVLSSLRDRPVFAQARSLDDRVFATKVLGAAGWFACRSADRSRRELVVAIAAELSGPLQADSERVEHALQLWEKVAAIHRTRVNGVERIEFIHEMVRDFAAAQYVVGLPSAARKVWFSSYAPQLQVVTSFVVELGGPSALNELLDATDDSDVEFAEVRAAALRFCVDADPGATTRVLKSIGRALASKRPVLVERIASAAVPLVERAPELVVRECAPSLDGPDEWNVLAALRVLVALPGNHAPVDPVLGFLERRVLSKTAPAGASAEVCWAMWNDLLMPALELMMRSGRNARVDRLVEALVREEVTISAGTAMSIAARLRSWGYAELRDWQVSKWQEQHSGRPSWDRETWEGDCAFLALVRRSFGHVQPAVLVENKLPNLGRLIAALGHGEAHPGEWSSFFFTDSGDEVCEVVKGVASAAGLDARALVAEAVEARARFVPETLPPDVLYTPLLTLAVPTPRPLDWTLAAGLNLSLDALFKLVRSRSTVLARAACELIFCHADQPAVLARSAEELRRPVVYVAQLLGGAVVRLFGQDAHGVLFEAVSGGITDQNAPILPILAAMAPGEGRVRALVAKALESAESAALLGAVRAACIMEPPPMEEMRRALERCTGASLANVGGPFCGTRFFPGNARTELFEAIAKRGGFGFDELVGMVTTEGSARAEAVRALLQLARYSSEILPDLLERLRSGRLGLDVLADVLELPDAVLAPYAALLLPFHEHEDERVRELMMDALGSATWIAREGADATLRIHLEDPVAAVRSAADRGLRRESVSGFARMTRRAKLRS